MLNCRAGKNAIVIGGTLNLGKIFKTISLVSPGTTITSDCGLFSITLTEEGFWACCTPNFDTILVNATAHSEHWLLDSPATWSLIDRFDTAGKPLKFRLPVLADARMKELLDIEGEDEMLTIAGLPQELAPA